VAEASAEPYANQHITPGQHPTTQFFTGQMPFLLPNQQRQSTEGKPAGKDAVNWLEQVAMKAHLKCCEQLIISHPLNF